MHAVQCGKRGAAEGVGMVVESRVAFGGTNASPVNASHGLIPDSVPPLAPRLTPPPPPLRLGSCEYQCLEQGEVVSPRVACLPEGAVPSRARFAEGDACALDVPALGSFHAVLASNLLCR